MPASLIILVHLSSWTLTKLPSSAGVLENASKPSVPIRALISGLSTILRNSALSRVTTSGGVCAGANTPIHESMSKLVTPASCKEGSSGNNVLRCILVTARARSAWALTWGRPLVRSMNIIDTRPPSTSLTAGVRASIGHMHEVDAGPGLERFAGHHAGCVAARKRQLAGMGLGVGDQLRNGCRGHIRMQHQHQGEAADARDRLEVLYRIVGDALVEAGRGRVRAVGAHQQRVAIGCGAGDIGGGHGAVRSRLVLDDDALVERLSEMLRNDTRNGVGGAAGTERDDEGDRLVRILALQRTLHLCGGARGHGKQRGAGCDDHAKQTCHASSLPVAVRCYRGCRSPRIAGR